MKLASLEHFEIDPKRLGLLGVAASAASGTMTAFVLGDSLGQAETPAAFVVAALVFYVVLSTPRRLVDSQRVSQAAESPLLSASASTCLAVTGSRPRTLVLLNARDPGLAASLKDAGRRVLLGTKVESAVDGSARSLVSFSAAAAIRGVATFSANAIGQGDEETKGLISSAELSRETKIPMFLTVCFFAPIMLTLYAVFSHSYDAVKLGELVAFEFIVVDLAFYLSSADRSLR